MKALRVIRVPSFPRGRARHLARRGFSAAARAAVTEKHTLAAVGAAGALGFAKRMGVSLPKIDALGTAGTYGVVAWAGARFMKSRTLSHVATGLLCVAAYQHAAGGGSVSGDDLDDLSGDLD
jgi:hypothetical protein